MSSISFDTKGVLYYVGQLLFNINDFRSKKIEDISRILEENFTRLSSIKPEGRRRFCDYVSSIHDADQEIAPETILKTTFFMGLQSNTSSKIHQRVVEKFVPIYTEHLYDLFPQSKLIKNAALINEWFACFAEAYLSDEQIESTIQAVENNGADIATQRGKVGKELYASVQAKQFSEEDLDTMLFVTSIALESLKNSEHPAEATKYAGKYLELFASSNNSESLITDVTGKLATVFRDKFFKKEELKSPE